MNKSELVEVAAQEAGITKAAADKALSAIVNAVVGAVAKGDSVTLVGFGTFKSSPRAARTGKNPKTGATSRFRRLSCRNLLRALPLKRLWRRRRAPRKNNPCMIERGVRRKVSSAF